MTDSQIKDFYDESEVDQSEWVINASVVPAWLFMFFHLFLVIGREVNSCFDHAKHMKATVVKVSPNR
jgi:hypothetical protein